MEYADDLKCCSAERQLVAPEMSSVVAPLTKIVLLSRYHTSMYATRKPFSYGADCYDGCGDSYPSHMTDTGKILSM